MGTNLSRLTPAAPLAAAALFDAGPNGTAGDRPACLPEVW